MAQYIFILLITGLAVLLFSCNNTDEVTEFISTEAGESDYELLDDEVDFPLLAAGEVEPDTTPGECNTARGKIINR